ARADELQGLRTELAEARRAESVLAAQRELQRAEQELAGARETEAAAAHAVDGVEAESPAGQLRSRAGSLREQAGELAGAIEEANRQREQQRRLEDVDAEAEAAQRRVAQIGAELDGLPERLEDLREQLTVAKAAAAKVEHARTARDELLEALADAQRLPVLQEALEQAQERLRAAVDAHQDAREEQQRLRERRLAGMAAELAGKLVAGESFPGCCSCQHPAPAHPTADAVREADAQTAAAADDEAQQARTRAEQDMHDARAAVTELQVKLRGRTADELQRELDRTRRELAELEEAVARAAELEAAVASTQDRIEELTAARATAERAVAAAEAEREGLVAAIEERTRRLEEARGEYDSVEQRRSVLLAQAAACDALADARAAVAACQARVTEQQTAVADAATAAGFSSVEAALAAAREPEIVRRLESEVSEAEVEERAARAVLAEPELFGSEPDMEVDVAGALEEAERARAAADAARVAQRAAETRAEQLEQLGKRLTERSAELEPLEAEFAELDALTDVLNGRGQNAKRMSLRSYVLAARLEEVAVAATARLRVMSQGRYAFVHSDAAGARGTRGGLGLDVLDDYSGMVRSAKTLSGGETFLASLALALGLADVVSAEAGGVQLDTLFIDEGFGTLDAETLDVVMDTLDSLRAGGRVVGLVSHVEEMRQRIPTRLHVRKSRTGSTLQLQA